MGKSQGRDPCIVRMTGSSDVGVQVPEGKLFTGRAQMCLAEAVAVAQVMIREACLGLLWNLEFYRFCLCLHSFGALRLKALTFDSDLRGAAGHCWAPGPGTLVLDFFLLSFQGLRPMAAMKVLSHFALPLV